MKNKLEMENYSSSLKWLNEVTGKRKWEIIVLLIFQAVLGVLTVGYAMILREMIDAAVLKDREAFLVGVISFIGLVVLQIAIQAGGRFFEEDARSTLENRLKKRLFSTLLEKEYGSVTAVHSGEWMNRLTSDTVVVADGLVQILPGVTGMAIRMVGALIMILVLEPRFGMIVIPGGILLVGTTYVFRKYMKKLHKKIQEKDGRLRVFLQENLGSLLVVRSFAVEEQVVSEAEAKMNEHKKARMKRNFFSNICNIGFSAIMRGVYLICAIYCSYGIMTGTVSYGTFTAMLQLISQVQSPVANITGYLPKYYAMLASAERLMEAEAFIDECADELVPMEMIHRYYKNDFAKMGMANVSFTYLPPVRDLEADGIGNKEKMPIVLKNINLDIEKGDYVAFTGQSGSGKSTLLKLFMCLYPLDAGERFLEDRNNNRRALTSAWHKLFAYVPQGNQLMSGSIREIVAFADKTQMQDEARVRRALEIACADEFVDTLEEGLDTILGERGQGLSEGQMQRIAIARAIFSDNPILILDESTSALDDNTEKRVLENLKKMTDKTVLIVTHRTAALDICNKQFVISEEGIETR